MSIQRNVAIIQRITAGSQFDGQAPSTTPAEADNIRSFPTDTQGGLFEFDGDYHTEVRQVQIDFGGQSSWVLSMTDGSEDFVIETGTNETSWYAQDVATIPEGWKLKLVTTGANQAMKAMVWYQRSPIL